MWTNDAKSHELKFTCLFMCPMAGVYFACGSWMNKSGGEVVIVEDQLFWYSELSFMAVHLFSVLFTSSLHHWDRSLFSIPTFKKTKSRPWMRKQQKPPAASLFMNAVERIWRSCNDIKMHPCRKRVLLFFQSCWLELTYQQYSFHWMMICCMNNSGVVIQFYGCRFVNVGAYTIAHVTH